jgi:hypothetical protein
LIDTGGNPKWQYSTPNGGGGSTTILYKEINLSTDMVIATNGDNYIYYNRIVSSPDSPYLI